MKLNSHDWERLYNQASVTALSFQGDIMHFKYDNPLVTIEEFEAVHECMERASQILMSITARVRESEGPQPRMPAHGH